VTIDFGRISSFERGAATGVTRSGDLMESRFGGLLRARRGRGFGRRGWLAVAERE